MEESPYKVLGLKEESSIDEIKERYRFLAKQYHPDHHYNAEDADDYKKEMYKINAAYERLVYGDTFSEDDEVHESPMYDDHRKDEVKENNYENEDEKIYKIFAVISIILGLVTVLFIFLSFLIPRWKQH